MKRYFSGIFLFLLIPSLSNSCTKQDEFPVLKGPYLGQTPPGETAEVFAPGIISHGFHEHSLSISPDGSEIYYATADAGYSLYRIVSIKRDNDLWSAPQLASFSSEYSDSCPLLSPDGKELLFISTRPLPGQTEGKDLRRIWHAEKNKDLWGTANPLEIPIPHDAAIANPCLSENGTLYFQYSHGGTGWDLYQSNITNGIYKEPISLGSTINTDYNESAPFFASNENCLLFHSNRPGGYGGMDIYVSFLRPDGSFMEPINLGEKINSQANDWRPVLSADGKYLFFSSYRSLESENFEGKSYKELISLYRNPQNGTGTLFWADAGVITELRKSISQ